MAEYYREWLDRSIPKENRQEAYEGTRVKAGTRRDAIYRLLKEKKRPMTADEIMEIMGFSDPNSVRPRLTELRDADLIRACGKSINRAGNHVTLWEVVE